MSVNSMRPLPFEHDHRRLFHHVDRIRETALTGRKETVVENLKIFRNALRLHMMAEDCVQGFYGHAERIRPELSSTTKELRIQHQQMLHMLDDMIRCMETDRNKVPRILKAFLILFQKHERHEDRLIQEAFYQDEAAPASAGA